MDPGADHAWRPPTPGGDDGAETLTGFERLVEIGRGGDSVVYRARQIGLDREVAIKVVGETDPERVARFGREVQITVELGRQHPNIVNVLAVGTTASGRPALVMDYFDAGTLHDRLREQGPLAAEEVARIGEVLADALAFAHGRGVLHRDVKPQNVLLLPTSWVLADFGIARLTDSEHTSSAETFTYRHASPQILDGLAPSAADDIWSLGSTLFTLLDGRPPFASDDPDDDSALAYLRRVRVEEPRRLSTPAVPGLADIVARCLSKDVDARWPDAAELRDALASVQPRVWEPRVGAEARDHTRPRTELLPSAGADVSPTDAGFAPGSVRDGAGPPRDHSDPQSIAPESSAPEPTAEPAAAPADAALDPGLDLGADPALDPGADPTPGPAAPGVGPTDDAPVAAPPTPAPPAARPPRSDPPAPAAAAPVALSALAHGGRPDPVDEADLTGHVPADRGLDPAQLPEALGVDDGADLPRKPRRLLWVLVAGAAAVGLSLGAAGVALRAAGNDDRQTQRQTQDTSPSQGAQPIPTASNQPLKSGLPQADPRPDPKLAPIVLNLSVSTSVVTLKWTDPSEGAGTVSLLRPNKHGGKWVANFPAGATEGEVPLATMPGKRICFALLLSMPDGAQGFSKSHCATAE